MLYYFSFVLDEEMQACKKELARQVAEREARQNSAIEARHPLLSSEEWFLLVTFCPLLLSEFYSLMSFLSFSFQWASLRERLIHKFSASYGKSCIEGEEGGDCLASFYFTIYFTLAL